MEKGRVETTYGLGRCQSARRFKQRVASAVDYRHGLDQSRDPMSSYSIALVAFGVSVFVLVTMALAVYFKPQARSGTWIIFLVGLFKVLDQALIVAKLDGFAFDYPFLIRSTYPLQLGSITLLYIYTLAFGNPDFRLKQLNPWHLAPFTVGVLWYLGVLIFGSPTFWQPTDEFLIEKTVRVGFAAVLSIPYLYWMYLRVKELEVKAHDVSSDFEDVRLLWLKYLLLLCCLGVLFSFLHVLTGPQIILWSYNGLLTMAGLLGLDYLGIRYSKVFDGERATSQANNTLTESEVSSNMERILAKLKGEQLYLKPQLRLQDLANSTGIKSYKISEVIRRGAGTNFYELVNSLRVEHAKRLLTDAEHSHLNLIGVAMDSGFNSKTAFNDAFRRIVGMTPSQFRSQPENDRIA